MSGILSLNLISQRGVNSYWQTLILSQHSSNVLGIAVRSSDGNVKDCHYIIGIVIIVLIL